MDHRALLKKYMAHVGALEGFCFLDYQPDQFNAEEWAELETIEAEISREIDERYGTGNKVT